MDSGALRAKKALGELRRKISLVTWKANTNCLLARVSLTGEGSTEERKRRKLCIAEEKIMHCSVDV